MYLPFQLHIFMLIESFVVGGIYRQASSCNTPECQYAGALAISAIEGVISAIILFMFLWKLFWDLCECINIHSDDEGFLMDNRDGQTISNVNLFQSGV